MWKHAFTTVASVSVLVLGVALPVAPADARAEAAMPAAADARVAAAVAAEAADARLSLAGQVALGDAALRTLGQRRAEAAAAAARAEAQRLEQEKAAREAAAAEAAAAQAAAAQAAAAQAAVAQAAPTASSGTAAAKPPVKKPAATRPPVAPAGSAFAWRTTIVDSGGQDAVDRCLGGLTRWYQDVDGKPYYPIHRSCGGTPILGLRRGDRVQIDGATWVVTDFRDVPKGSHYSAAAGLAGQILLQTCYRNSTTMRIVALTAG